MSLPLLSSHDEDNTMSSNDLFVGDSDESSDDRGDEARAPAPAADKDDIREVSDQGRHLFDVALTAGGDAEVAGAGGEEDIPPSRAPVSPSELPYLGEEKGDDGGGRAGGGGARPRKRRPGKLPEDALRDFARAVGKRGDEWEGVTRGPGGEILKINWYSKDLDGTVETDELRFMPHLRRLDLSANPNVTGEYQACPALPPAFPGFQLENVPEFGC